MSIRAYCFMRALPFYVAIALAWAIGLALMVLATRPSYAALEGYPVPASRCLCDTWLLIVGWLGASAFAAIGFTAAALFAAGGRDD
jgi:hypothetical protein